MNLLEKIGLEEDFQKYESVDAQRQDAWNHGLSSVEKELKHEAASYISEERTRSAKIAELSKIKMLG
jgi:hypothetical protein